MKGTRNLFRRNPFLKWVLLIRSWIFQGIPRLDFFEMVYRLLFDLVFFISFFLLLKTKIGIVSTFLLSFFMSHSINWIVNVNLVSIIVHVLLLKKISKIKVFFYLKDLEIRVQDKDWLQYCAVFGSICRNELNKYSDIDVSIVRKPGFINGIKGIFFVLKERKFADFGGIPLELYLNDKPINSLRRFAEESIPIVLANDGSISLYFNKVLTLDDFSQGNIFDEKDNIHN